MVKKSFLLFIFFILSAQIYSQENKDFTLSLSAGISLDIASFGIEKKYLSIQGAFLTPGRFPLGVKPHFSFNNDHFSVFIPAVMTFPIPLDEEKLVRLIPYVGGGLTYLSDTSTAHPSVTAGMELHYKSLFIDIPILAFFKGSDPDTIIGLYMGWSFRL